MNLKISSFFSFFLVLALLLPCDSYSQDHASGTEKFSLLKTLKAEMKLLNDAIKVARNCLSGKKQCSPEEKDTMIKAGTHAGAIIATLAAITGAGVYAIRSRRASAIEDSLENLKVEFDEDFFIASFHDLFQKNRLDLIKSNLDVSVLRRKFILSDEFVLSQETLNKILVKATHSGSIDAVSIILDKKGLPSLQSALYNSHFSDPEECENNRAAIVRLLVEKGADVNQRIEYYIYGTDKSIQTTPLICAINEYNVILVKTLLELKANKNIIDSTGRTAFNYAQQETNRHQAEKEAILELLGEQEATPPVTKKKRKGFLRLPGSKKN